MSEIIVFAIGAVCGGFFAVLMMFCLLGARRVPRKPKM